jgi:hypothetical protein
VSRTSTPGRDATHTVALQHAPVDTETMSLQVHLSNKRLGLVTDELDKAAPGTVETALRNLIAYRSSLENRLLSRFMDACSQSVRSQPREVAHTGRMPVEM